MALRAFGEVDWAVARTHRIGGLHDGALSEALRDLDVRHDREKRKDPSREAEPLEKRLRRLCADPVRKMAEASLEDFLGELRRQFPDCADGISAVRLAVEEALVNACSYGNKSDPTRIVMLQTNIDPPHVFVAVENEPLEPFDERSVPDPTLDENIERPYGRGLTLMRQFMHDVLWNDFGNRVEMMRLMQSNGNGTQK